MDRTILQWQPIDKLEKGSDGGNRMEKIIYLFFMFLSGLVKTSTWTIDLKSLDFVGVDISISMLEKCQKSCAKRLIL